MKAVAAFARKNWEMSGFQSKSWKCQREKFCQGKLPKNFSESCINRLFNTTCLVFYANYFMLFIAEFCLLVF